MIYREALHQVCARALFAAGCEDFATNRLTDVADTAGPGRDTNQRCFMPTFALINGAR
jgi:hypothetical protein